MEIESKESVLPDDTDGLCRICLTANHNNQYIFGAARNDSDGTDTYDLSDKFRLCSGVEVSLIFNLFSFSFDLPLSLY